ncbi:metallothionein-like protein type 2 [Juglans regia]|uniref:Metallothionein-like protein n=1 Tax=Juglans regia TaxID=51240 RepID=A0A2I4EUZ1_JUGRE|nr:metallothionein-like protein type 2 [Juglans regia]
MSCCGGNCGCGSGCKCGGSCNGCGMYPDLGYSEKTTTETIISGVAPVKKILYEGSETSFGAENGCKCGSNCTCDPCNCK